MQTLLLIIIGVLLLVAIVLIIAFNKKGPGNSPQLLVKVSELQSSLAKLETNLKDDFRNNREESAGIAKANREEINKSITDFRIETAESIRQLNKQNIDALEKLNTTLEQKVTALIEKTGNNFKTFSETNINQLEKIEKQVENKLRILNEQAKTDNNLIREAMIKSFKDFQDAFDKNVKSFNDLQREKFAQLEDKQNELVQGTEKKLETIRITVEEKLEKTLSERLGQSFETVGKQLIEVQKGLGEMQTIASDVGGLKKVLSNVKLRGGVGEVQLAMLLEQILAPTQYDANVITKAGSNDPVEFAIKLPGKSEDENNFVYLPIDAKFPKDTYEHLLAAYENALPDEIEAATKNLENTIKKMAKDIRDKYIDPPNTTDFAILFLPFESIYAEVIRRSALVDQLRNEFNITVAGPTTLVAILNSLQMGFRTLALQKRSSEVWKVLGAVKTEFEKFGGMLEKAQKNIQTGLGQLDNVVGTRTKAIQRKLKDVQSLPASEAQNILPDMTTDALDLETENETE
ncbi:MAG: DNA recombination protein RmuC [Chitinophagaceae bacterium]|nr:DNA recombination protein RmuC [Chitinophagaceae bacterium]